MLVQGAAGRFDHGGVATPSAAVSGGRILLSYSGRRHTLPPTDPVQGTRGIGLAVAAHPLGPFVRRPTPLVDVDGYADDPQLIVLPPQPGGAATSEQVPGHLWLYHRLSQSAQVPGCKQRCVRLLTSRDSGKSWVAAADNVCLRSAAAPGVCLADTAEPLEGKVVTAAEGAQAVVLVMDQPDRAFVSAPLSQANATAPTTLWQQPETDLGLPSCASRPRLRSCCLPPLLA